MSGRLPVVVMATTLGRSIPAHAPQRSLARPAARRPLPSWRPEVESPRPRARPSPRHTTTTCRQVSPPSATIPPIQDRQGKTLLIHSCARGLVGTVEELAADPNIDVNIADNEGNTALIHAAAAGHAKVVQTLIDGFPALQLDQANKLGQSALMKAAIQGRTSCAKVLLKAGADPYKRDFGRQFCALEWAEYVGRTECAHLIADLMLAEPRQERKLAPASDNLKQVACLVAIPLIGGDLPVVARPRVRSAPPVPALKITPSEGRFAAHAKAQRSVSRPTSSMA